MALIITINISNREEKILLNDLLDIDDWFQKAKNGKINKCAERAALQYDVLAKKQNLATVPTQAQDRIDALFADPSYKNRSERDEEEGIR